MKSRFGEGIARAWSSVEATEDGVTITNTDPRLAIKISGGVIEAKRAKALTIPVDPRAHNRRAIEFQSWFRLKLFRPRGKDYLAVIEDDGSFSVIYLLRKRVKVKPVKGAMPEHVDLDDSLEADIVKILWRKF
tara:strand:+ start:5072 stop:5470 length:399 start_codon:yes stop_codon:yes gene_type:complete